MTAPAERRLNSLRPLAAVIGVSLGTASTWSREPWFPPRGPGGWNVDEVLRAVAAHKRGEGPTVPAAPAIAPAAPPSTPPPSERASGDANDLKRVDDPIKVARAALAIAARTLGEASPIHTPRALDSVKKALEEMRRTEEGYLKLAVQRRELVPVEVAKAVGARAARRFVNALERLEGQLAAQLEAWLVDETFRGLSAEARRRAARAWVQEQARILRSTESEEIAKMIAAELDDRER